jgi:predicted permease
VIATALALAPDFGLIVFGFALARITGWSPAFWEAVERVTYFVLFPALLFYANARARIELGAAAPLLAVVVAALACGMALAVAARVALRPEAGVFAGSFQCAFRFNSYIGLALAGRLYGDAGVALMALAIGVSVPLVNVAAVWALARQSRAGVVKGLATNPLLISSAAGIAWGALGLPLPETAQAMLARLGNASLALGLLAVGAALRFELPRRDAAFAAAILAIKLAAVPAVAWALGRAVGLPAIALGVAVAFAALPAASSAYILAVRMGGDGRTVAILITLGTALSIATLPLWLALVRQPG